MKKLLFTIATIALGFSANAQVGIGTTTPSSSSMLDITSTSKGFLKPRMTTAQRTAISSPAKGLEVFDTDFNSTWFYDGTSWVNSAAGSTNYWTLNGTNLSNNSGTNVGIGTSTPSAQLQLGSTIKNRKIVIFDGYPSPGNDYQFYGFGISAGQLRYQVDATASDHVFYAASSANSSNELARIKGDGQLVVQNTITAPKLQGPSDLRFKKNITPIANALGKIIQLGGYTYDWKDASDFPGQTLGKGHDMGVIAQEVEKQFPEAVSTNAAGYKAVSYTELVPALIEAIKTLNSQVNELRAEVKELKK